MEQEKKQEDGLLKNIVDFGKKLLEVDPESLRTGGFSSGSNLPKITIDKLRKNHVSKMKETNIFESIKKGKKIPKDKLRVADRFISKLDIALNGAVDKKGNVKSEKPISDILKMPKKERVEALEKVGNQFKENIEFVQDKLQNDPAALDKIFSPREKKELALLIKGIEAQGGVDKFFEKQYGVKTEKEDLIQEHKEQTQKALKDLGIGNEKEQEAAFKEQREKALSDLGISDNPTSNKDVSKEMDKMLKEVDKAYDKSVDKALKDLGIGEKDEAGDKLKEEAKKRLGISDKAKPIFSNKKAPAVTPKSQDVEKKMPAPGR